MFNLDATKGSLLAAGFSAVPVVFLVSFDMYWHQAIGTFHAIGTFPAYCPVMPSYTFLQVYSTSTVVCLSF